MKKRPPVKLVPRTAEQIAADNAAFAEWLALSDDEKARIAEDRAFDRGEYYWAAGHPGTWEKE